jgi:hypothetical protein
MKKATLLFLFLPLFSFAQEVVIPVKPINQNEIGLNLFSITRFESYRGMLDTRQVSACLNAFPGIYYKRHFGQNAWRASFDYTQKSKLVGSATGSDSPMYHINYLNAETKNVGIAVGYERSFGHWKLKPYAFSDLVFNYENMSGVRAEHGCWGPIGIFEFSEECFEYGVSAGAGMRYSINSRIHLSYEFAAQGAVSVFQDLSNIGDKYIDLRYHLNPVNKLGFAVSF